MKRTIPLLAFAALMACAPAPWAYKGMHDGVDISYRWRHATGKPSELHLRLENTTSEDRSVSLHPRRPHAQRPPQRLLLHLHPPQQRAGAQR
jgi:hypothetical protein